MINAVSQPTLTDLFAALKSPAKFSNDRANILDHIYEALLKIRVPNIELATDSSGITTLGYACKNGYLNLAEKMLEKDEIFLEKIVNAGNPAPIWLAANNGHKDVVQLLLDKGKGSIIIDKKAPDGTTALMMSIAKDHSDIVDMFAKVVSQFQLLNECAKLGKSCYMSRIKPLDLSDQQRELLLINASCSNSIDTLKILTEIYGEKFEGLEEVNTYSVAIRKYLSLPTEPRKSFLVSLSEQFPAFNETVEQSQREEPLMTNSAEYFIDVRARMLGAFCFVQEQLLKAKDGILLLKNMSSLTSFECQEDCKKKKDCTIIIEVLNACKQLEEELNSPEETTLFSLLKPQFILVGSIAEGTRLGTVSEVDFTVQFASLKSKPFTVGNKATELLMPDIDYLQVYRHGKDSNALDYAKFLYNFLQEIRDCITKIKSTLPQNLTVNSTFELCSECKKLRKEESIYEPWTHCTDCFPSVTHTKVGPCLIFQWNDGSLNKPLIISVDLVPVFPVRGKSVLELYNIVIKTLIEDHPPEYMTYFNSIIKKDIILPECFDSHKSSDETVYVGVKLLNYGPDNNYIIRPAQEMQVQAFQKMPLLKEVYLHLKVLKALLEVDISSYFMKKVLLLLLPDLKTKAGDSKARFNELLYEALSQPDLKRAFGDRMDFGDMDVYVCCN